MVKGESFLDPDAIDRRDHWPAVGVTASVDEGNDLGEDGVKLIGGRRIQEAEDLIGDRGVSGSRSHLS